ncbi:MAG TPA: DUF805 domain-containing protein [Candidatus Saccharimonadales bacterium]|nr:DUF805 domain-containing protein [Candidatus Saccharimonadales bacterium]
MGFGESIKTVFSKYADFNGVASRPEYWWWTLFSFLVSAVLGVAFGRGEGSLGNTLVSLWSLATLLPSLAVAVRRLRDAGKHWGNLFWLLLPFVGWIIVIVYLAQPSVKNSKTSKK